MVWLRKHLAAFLVGAAIFGLVGYVAGLLAGLAHVYGSIDEASWLKDWQTLISGLLALFGAGMTVFVMQKQISATQKTVEEDRMARRRELAGSMAALLLDILWCIRRSVEGESIDEQLKLLETHNRQFASLEPGITAMQSESDALFNRRLNGLMSHVRLGPKRLMEDIRDSFPGIERNAAIQARAEAARSVLRRVRLLFRDYSRDGAVREEVGALASLVAVTLPFKDFPAEAVDGTGDDV